MEKHRVLTYTRQGALCQEAKSLASFLEAVKIPSSEMLFCPLSVLTNFFFLLPPKCFFLATYGLGCFLNKSVLLLSDAITSAADLFIYPCFLAQL